MWGYTPTKLIELELGYANEYVSKRMKYEQRIYQILNKFTGLSYSFVQNTLVQLPTNSVLTTHMGMSCLYSCVHILNPHTSLNSILIGPLDFVIELLDGQWSKNAT